MHMLLLFRLTGVALPLLRAACLCDTFLSALRLLFNSLILLGTSLLLGWVCCSWRYISNACDSDDTMHTSNPAKH